MWCQRQVVISLSWRKKKKSFSGSIIPSLLPILKLFLLFTFKKARTETSFQFVFSPLTFFPFFILFFPAPCFRVSAGGGGWLLGGHCSTIGSALENFSGSKRERERQQRVDGCVLCSITALTDMGKEGSRREWRKEADGRKWSGLILGGFKVL